MKGRQCEEVTSAQGPDCGGSIMQESGRTFQKDGRKCTKGLTEEQREGTAVSFPKARSEVSYLA